jgi:carbamoyl-phosphate synthase small subunit
LDIQLLTLTVPLVGNYGVPDPSNLDKFGLRKGFESSKIHATALLVQHYSDQFSHWNAAMSLGDWLKSEVLFSLSLLISPAAHSEFDRGSQA